MPAEVTSSKASAKTKAAKKNEKRKQKKESTGAPDATTSGRKGADDVADQLQSLECAPSPFPHPPFSSFRIPKLDKSTFNSIAQDLLGQAYFFLALVDAVRRVQQTETLQDDKIKRCKQGSLEHL